MSEFLDDPSVLTKDKLKNALLANNVSLPNGDQRKDVYVQLYLKNLTAQNKKKLAAADAFSSDEDQPVPVVPDKSRSGRKATRKTDKPRPEDVDVTELTNEDLKDQLLKYGISAGPIVASTRKLYEKRLQKLLDHGPPEAMPLPEVPAITDSNQNGNTDSDQYSDKEVPEPEPEPEPVPVVARQTSSRRKTTRSHSSQHSKLEEPHVLTKVPVVALHDIALLEDPIYKALNGRPTKESTLPKAVPLNSKLVKQSGLPHDARAEVSISSALNSCAPSSPVPKYGRDVPSSTATKLGSPFRAVTPHKTMSASKGDVQQKLDSTDARHKGRQQKIVPFLPSITPVKGNFSRPSESGVDKLAAGDHTPRPQVKDVLKEMFPEEPSTPTGIIATCRRPIRGAAGRGPHSNDSWLEESRLRLSQLQETTTTTSSSYLESRSTPRLSSSVAPPNFSSSSSSRLLSAKAPAAPPSVQTRVKRWLPVWVQLLLFGAMLGFLFFVYQTMETNQLSPFFGQSQSPQIDG
ncbi:thymopoietin a isoform X2 [Denticeps clupeoides]|uniref:thymopoietin a isoform X2 n=1 Tax=Denticeps clupeoides TaxID=299321 RepID=UPI0010A40464|nr:lamina-associated polypeptide 2-like isoform X2 [Denticeps clupeoides]